jgi:hypothetical protein
VQAEFFKRDFLKFQKFKKLAQATKLEERLHLEIIAREMFLNFPVLILLDIGGSLMYRHGVS